MSVSRSPMKLLCLLFAASLHVALSSAETCGRVNPAPRSIGQLVPLMSNGDPIGYEKYPWFVRLTTFHEGYPYNGNGSCGGSLISERHVITAGHCVDYKAFLAIKYGQNSTNDELDYMVENFPVYTHAEVKLGVYDNCIPSSTVEVIKVASSAIKIHENYELIVRPRMHSVENDIAMVTLPSRVLGRTPVCLPVKGMKQNLGYVIGFGITETGNLPCKLLQGEFKILSTKTCKNMFPLEGMGIYSEKKIFCASRSRGGTGSGDSGGPFMMKDDSGQYTIIGVVSFGSSLSGSLDLTYFTDIFEHLAWIRASITDASI